MSEELKRNLKAKQTWLRGLFLVLFAVIWSIAEIVLVVVVLIQFFTVLFTGKKNDALLQFGSKVSDFFYDVARYVTFNQDEKPFPFNSNKSASAANVPAESH